MIVKKSDELGYMDKAMVCMCSEKHSKLVPADAFEHDKPALTFDVKAIVPYKTFRRAIYFLEKEYESVVFNVHDGSLFFTVDSDSFGARIRIPYLEGTEKDQYDSCENKYSLEYLKAFCMGFAEKDMSEIELNLSSSGDYPLEIHYRGDQWLILAPRVKRSEDESAVE